MFLKAFVIVRLLNCLVRALILLLAFGFKLVVVVVIKLAYILVERLILKVFAGTTRMKLFLVALTDSISPDAAVPYDVFTQP